MPGDHDGHAVLHNVGGYPSVNVERVELFRVASKSSFGARCGIGQGNRFGAAGGWGHALVEGLNEVVDLRGRERGLTSCFLHRVGIPDSFGHQGCHDQPF